VFEGDIAKLTRLSTALSAGPLRTTLQQVLPLASKVTKWAAVPTSGFVVCRYAPDTGLPQSYEVTAQTGNLGNLVHELTHVAVNEAYHQDFVNYPNNGAINVPDRTYDELGRCTNEFERQTKFMNDALNQKCAAKLTEFKIWANACELPLDKKSAVTSKLDYGLQWPHKEYDTVINQILVWLFEWGYPIRGPFKKKPVVNALWEEVEKAVAQANQSRASQMPPKPTRPVPQPPRAGQSAPGGVKSLINKWEDIAKQKRR